MIASRIPIYLFEEIINVNVKILNRKKNFKSCVMSLPKETSIFGELSRSRAYIMYNICTLAVNLPMDAEKARD